MKKTFTIIMVTLFTFAVVSICYAVEEKRATPAPSTSTTTQSESATAPAEKPKIKQITGEIKALDTKTMTVTVMKKMKDQVKEVTSTITEKTKITMDKAKKTLADLKVGDKVTLKYTESAGKNIAKSIAIKSTASTEKK